MSPSFRVQVLGFTQLEEIEGARSTEDFAELLDAMEFGDRSGLSAEELREMCIMSLQDLTPVEAAYLVLTHDMGDVLRDGQVRNLATEMLEEKLWEDYADSSLHERMFHAGSLLYAAFPRSFPKPDAVHVELEVKAVNAAAREFLVPSPDESFLARLLADGMDDRAVLNRLYGDQLKGGSFPAASEVVWILHTEEVGEDVMRFGIIGSGYWLDALDEVEGYDSTAYADKA